MRIDTRAFRVAGLATVLALAAGCGGGGGGGARTGTLAGRLLLEQSPPASSAGLGAREQTSVTHREKEPNQHLFNAVDLGAGGDVALDGSVGAVHDPLDVLRFGPAAGATVLEVRFLGDAAGADVFELTQGAVPRSGRPVRDAVSVRLSEGDELLITVTATRPADYRIEIGPDTRAADPAGERIPYEAVLATWERVLGRGVEVANAEILFCRERPLDAGVVARHGLRPAGRGGPVARWRIPGVAPGPGGLLRIANVLRDVRRACPDADYASPNLWTPPSRLAGLPLDPNDPLFASMQFNLKDTRFPQAWEVTTGDDDVAIAVMDTGILSGHPDLAPRLSPLGYDFISDKDSAGDGDGIDADPTEPDDFGTITLFHGSYVTGVLGAASNNATGIAGGTWRGKIIPIRIFGARGGSTNDRIQAMRYLAGLPNASGRILTEAQRPRVVNMSYADFTATAAERAEVVNLAAAGIHMVAAAGNDGRDPSPPLYPAAWPEVIGVGAVDRARKRTSYSNAGPFVDVVAFGGTELAGPGGITSTWGLKINGKLEYLYNSFLGTSVATPSITAAVALMEAVHRRMDPSILTRILRDTSLDLGDPGRDTHYGWGLLRADSAVGLARSLSGPPLARLDPPGYTFPNTERETTLQVTNAGGRVLKDLALRAVGTPSGALRVSLGAMSAPTSIIAALDRSQVIVGSYRDTFELSSNGATATFDLVFRKPIPPAPPAIDVQLFDGSTLVGRVQTDASGDFSFGELPLGTYRLEAGVDVNRNGRLGDSQEWFLARDVQVTGDRSSELNGVVVPWKD